MSCKDNKDGSCSVEYIPFTPGEYDVNITFGGLPIPGERAEGGPDWSVVERVDVCCGSGGLGMGRGTWRRLASIHPRKRQRLTLLKVHFESCALSLEI